MPFIKQPNWTCLPGHVEVGIMEESIQDGRSHGSVKRSWTEVACQIDSRYKVEVDQAAGRDLIYG